MRSLSLMPSNFDLTAKDLEAGLSMLDQGAIAADAFWDANVINFRHTLFAAIQETSEFLLAKQIPAHRRLELETQLEDLRGYITIVDCYVENREGQLRSIN